MYHICTKNKKDTQFLPKCIPGSGRQYPKTFVIIIACPLRCNFVTRFMSLQNSLFDIVPPQTLRKPESDTDWGDDTQVKKCKTKSWKTNTTIWTSSKRRLTVHVVTPQYLVHRLKSWLVKIDTAFCWISATHLNHNFTLSYHLLLTQNNLQFSSDNFLYIYLTPYTLFVKRIWQVNKKV